MIFEKKTIEHKCLFLLSLQPFSEKIIILKEIQQGTVDNLQTPLYEVAVIHCRFS
jgi:hypothetical protein